jgi:hypothetical protein
MHPLTQYSRFAERCSPQGFSALIHMWHPDSLETLNTYFSSSASFVPTFSDARSNYHDDWLTSITLHHWNFARDDFPEGLTKVFDKERESGQVPPKSFMNKTSSASSDTKSLKILEERASSVVMSGDARGDFWTLHYLIILHP